MPGTRGSCDAGFGEAQYVVEITRIKTKETATFRLCNLHSQNLRRADRSAQTFLMNVQGRDCGTVAEEPEEDEDDG